MFSIPQLKELLTKHDVSPNKVLGQSFLVNEKALQGLVEAADISKNDTIVEVGSGPGIITKALAENAKRVIAVEKDKKLVPILADQIKEYANVEIVEGDILRFDPKKYGLANNSYKLVGNPPYYLTSRLFRTFLENIASRPSRIVLTIQKETAQKIVSDPPRMNLLSVSVQVFGKPRIVRMVSKGAFWPMPRVDSAILVVEVYQKPITENVSKFFKIVHSAFLHPRKQLKNTLPLDQLEKAGIEPTRRPQTLTIEEWVKIVDVV